MNLLQTILIDVGRLGMGAIFLFSVILDIKSRPQLFELMTVKRVPMPWLFFLGAITWKALTSLGIIFNYYGWLSALLLAVYIFIANVIFNNFWAVPHDQRDFTLVQFLIHLASCFGLIVVAGTF